LSTLKILSQYFHILLDKTNNVQSWKNKFSNVNILPFFSKVQISPTQSFTSDASVLGNYETGWHRQLPAVFTTEKVLRAVGQHGQEKDFQTADISVTSMT